MYKYINMLTKYTYFTQLPKFPVLLVLSVITNLLVCLFIEYREGGRINFLKSKNILPLLLKFCLFCGMFIDNYAVRKTLWHYEYSKMLINGIVYVGFKVDK